MKAVSVQFENPRTVEPEDRVRADFYALLASLFYAAPDDRLLAAVAVSAPPGGEAGEKGEQGDALAQTWSALAAASAVVTPEAVHEEHESLFVGMGRPPVMLFGSFYLAGFMNEKPLAELRTDLAKLGFTRHANVTEPEDHLAALCEVMRGMILGDVATPAATLAEQKRFFARHMQPWVLLCCNATLDNEKANYYVRVAQFARAFFEIEIAAFEMV
jgi:TorA maturation chaperone TorD